MFLLMFIIRTRFRKDKNYIVGNRNHE